MRVRHRIPTIFNLSMVDVLCCALGCVILLWLLNLREARDRAVRAGQATELVKTTQASLDTTTSRLRNLENDHNTLVKERDRLRRDWELARSQLDSLTKQVADLKEDN